MTDKLSPTQKAMTEAELALFNKVCKERGEPTDYDPLFDSIKHFPKQPHPNMTKNPELEDCSSGGKHR